MPAIGLENHDAKAWLVAELIHRRKHTADETPIIGVVHFRAVQRHRRDTALIEIPQNRIGSHSAIPFVVDCYVRQYAGTAEIDLSHFAMPVMQTASPVVPRRALVETGASSDPFNRTFSPCEYAFSVRVPSAAILRCGSRWRGMMFPA
jgi:hypothetical protein